MHVGFLTACFPRLALEDIVPWAAEQGFATLELAAWPLRSERDYMARHIEAEDFSASDAERVKDLLGEYGLAISAMAYYDNNLHPDLKEREENLAHLRKVIDAAQLLGVERVGTFVGGRPADPKEIMKEIGTIFRDLTKYASDRGVKLMIENCPMDNWVQFGLPGNYAYSPELWEALFNEVPDENFGLNFDPSHLYWLGIDYNRAAREFADRIFHVHAKDAEMIPEGLYRYGTLSRQLGDDPWKLGWWRYRMPGKGEIDWGEFLRTISEIGYDDAVSIEHEDPEYEGTVEKVKEGLKLGREHLEQFV
ncbi:MAG: sugar phosphate isomerase/epimerase family protein [Rhodothermales bacterium]